MDSLCVRYYGVQFQGKVGALIINDEKVLFRPKVEHPSQDGTKPPTRSWRWTAIDRIEVLDPPRSTSDAALRGLKLKAKNAGGKGVTVKVPQDVLEEVLLDMSRRMAPDSLGIEGAVLKTTPLAHKEVPPPSMRRSSLPGNLQSSSLHSPKGRTGQTLRNTHVKKAPGMRRASMPTMSMSKPEPIPEQAEVSLPAETPTAYPPQERFLNKVGQKLKLSTKSTLGKPQRIPQESKQPLLLPSSNRSSTEGDDGSKGSASASSLTKQRKLLEFMKPPPLRRNVSAEVEEMERKVQEQLARRKAQHQKTVERRKTLEAVKLKHSTRDLMGSSSHSSNSEAPSTRRHSAKPRLSTPTQRPKPKVKAATATTIRKTTKQQQQPTQRDMVFDEIVKEDEQDLTSVTDASSPENSPVVDDEPNAILWNPNSPENKFKMMILQHAATCEQPKGCCPYDPICSDHQNLLKHIETCTEDADCTFPRCIPTRNFLVTMRLMQNENAADDQSNKDFLVGMGAIAPVPVIDISSGNAVYQSGDWDAFSMVSDTSWWEHAGH